MQRKISGPIRLKDIVPVGLEVYQNVHMSSMLWGHPVSSCPKVTFTQVSQSDTANSLLVFKFVLLGKAWK